jgi:hypothetical protein
MISLTWGVLIALSSLFKKIAKQGMTIGNRSEPFRNRQRANARAPSRQAQRYK